MRLNDTQWIPDLPKSPPDDDMEEVSDINEPDRVEHE